MKIIKNPDKEKYNIIIKNIESNNGYCPCLLEQNSDTLCPCKKFRETKECICGLYITIKA